MLRASSREFIGDATTILTLRVGQKCYARSRLPLAQSGSGLIADPTGVYWVEAQLSSAEVSDPDAGTWTLTGSMTTPRRYAAASLLTNGAVLVAAGSVSRSTGGLPAQCFAVREQRSEGRNDRKPVRARWSSFARDGRSFVRERCSFAAA